MQNIFAKEKTNEIFQNGLHYTCFLCYPRSISINILHFLQIVSCH